MLSKKCETSTYRENKSGAPQLLLICLPASPPPPPLPLAENPERKPVLACSLEKKTLHKTNRNRASVF